MDYLLWLSLIGGVSGFKSPYLKTLSD